LLSILSYTIEKDFSEVGGGSLPGHHIDTCVLTITSSKNNPQKIAKFLVENGENDAVIYIGENLSYEDECISSGKASEIAELKKEYNINAVIIERIKR
jgi:precorrin-6B methylase 1